MIPMRVVALRLNAPSSMHGAMADFSRLPFVGREGDVNSNAAYLSETVVSPPFDHSLTLPAGVHLHWFLPDAMAQSRDTRDASDETFEFPAVPTAWHVVREVEGKPELRKAWVVESDYLHDVETRPDSNSICFPITPGAAQKYGAPFRHMGRSQPWSATTKLASQNQRLRYVLNGGPLTAIGYGEPSFSSFYPNCHSVFGFCDSEPPEPTEKTTYYVLGWYREDEDDFCNVSADTPQFVHQYDAAMRARTVPDEDHPGRTFLHQAYNELFGWDVQNDHDQIPKNSLLYASCKLDQRHAAAAHAPEADVSVALGNTPTEALSAHLGRVNLDHTDIVEDRLEALVLAGDIAQARTDTQAKFEELRHAVGFRALPGGKLYEIRRVHKEPEEKTGSLSKPPPKSTGFDLPDNPAWAHLLNTLNAAHWRLDKLRSDLESAQKQTFADWYKYMLCVYPPDGQGNLMPDIDVVKAKINDVNLPQITALRVALDDADAQVVAHKSALDRAISTWAESAANAAGALFEVVKVDAPRFWQANEPVVLLTGLDADRPVRHSKGALLRCWQLDEVPSNVLNAADFVIDKLKEHSAQAKDVDQGQSLSPATQWAPFMLEWETTLAPVAGHSDRSFHSSQVYNPEDIRTNFDLPLSSVDLKQRSIDNAAMPRHASYSGQCFLTGHAAPMLRKQAETFLDGHLLPFYKLVIGKEAQSDDTKALAKAKSWFEKLSTQERALFRFETEGGGSADGAPSAAADWYLSSGWRGIDEFMDAVLEIDASEPMGTPSLSQSLSGFNAALIGQKQTMQLTIADPLAFPDANGSSDYQDFAKKVHDAVHPFNRVAPEPFYDFHPLRCGTLDLSRLRLVDTFGQTADVPQTAIKSPAVSRMLWSGDTKNRPQDKVLLPPRLAQPARVNLRWLSADHGPGYEGLQAKDDLETNAHPATSPICGWIVPDALNGEIEVFNQTGLSLGSLDLNGTWHDPPRAVSQNERPDDVNPHLQRVIDWLKRPDTQTDTIMGEVMSALATAMEHIDPEDWNAHESLALLMGRPLAIVRASVSLELQGTAALSPDWETFRKSLGLAADHQAASAMLGSLKYPVRIGAHERLNDGVAGFWIEQPTEDGLALSDTLLAPQSDGGNGELTEDARGHCVRSAQSPDEHDNPFCIDLTLDGSPVSFTTLLDPRGSLHCVSGILPVKSISIPRDYFEDAIKKLEISFPTAPLISPRFDEAEQDFAIEVPVPVTPGYKWAWREARAAQTGETSWVEAKQLSPVGLDAKLSDQMALRDGWLILRQDKKTTEPPPTETTARTKP